MRNNAKSIRATFKSRNTGYIENHTLFTSEFGTDKKRNKIWIAFIKKIEIEDSIPFPDVMIEIKRVLLPIWNALA